jgi:polyphosphate kinase 2 (PPK2 family)
MSILNTQTTTPKLKNSPQDGPTGKQNARHELAEHRHDPEYIENSFRSGDYPYKTKISKKAYEIGKTGQQIELLKVQKWVKQSGQKIVILFESRDAAGNGRIYFG